MRSLSLQNLSRRERQIMDVLFESGKATANEVQDRMPEAPSNSTVRTMLRTLEEKGFVRHEQAGPRYEFFPTLEREQVRQGALRRLLDVFFDSSTEQVVAELLDLEAQRLDEEDFDRLAQLVENARNQGDSK